MDLQVVSPGLFGRAVPKVFNEKSLKNGSEFSVEKGFT
jgi:hypothetical protein